MNPTRSRPTASREHARHVLAADRLGADVVDTARSIERRGDGGSRVVGMHEVCPALRVADADRPTGPGLGEAPAGHRVVADEVAEPQHDRLRLLQANGIALASATAAGSTARVTDNGLSSVIHSSPASAYKKETLSWTSRRTPASCAACTTIFEPSTRTRSLTFQAPGRMPATPTGMWVARLQTASNPPNASVRPASVEQGDLDRVGAGVGELSRLGLGAGQTGDLVAVVQQCRHRRRVRGHRWRP